MSTILYFLIFMYGAALGSFSLVLSNRYRLSSPWSGRSKCDSCNKSLSWYETIPVFSFLFLNGRCLKCKSKIPKEAFLVEAGFGLLSIAAYFYLLREYFEISPINYFSGVSFAILYSFLFVLFFAVVMYDIKHKIVPLLFSFWIIVIGLAFGAFRIFDYIGHPGSYLNTVSFYLDLFSGFLIALPFFLIFIFTRGAAVGGGDVLLYFGVGYLVGFVNGVSLFLISIWIGALFSIILMILDKKYNRKSEIPFAPFIIIATLIIIFFQMDIAGLSFML